MINDTLQCNKQNQQGGNWLIKEHLNDIDLQQHNMNKECSQSSQKTIIDIKQQQDRYKKIGSGGFGSVYQQDNNTVLKVVQLNKASNESTETMQKQQKANIRCINNEIAIYKYLNDKQFPHMLNPLSYIYNEQLTGILLDRAHITLLDYLNMLEIDIKLPYFDYKVCLFLHIIQQILVIIQDIHKYGVVHCDIKPHNIMIKFDQMGKLKIFLIDFGLSYIQDQQLPGIQGTETYIDPQFIWTGEPSIWCDIWSICSLILQVFAEDHDFRVLQISCLKKMKEIDNYQQVLQKVLDNRINQIKQPNIKLLLKHIMKIQQTDRLDITEICRVLHKTIQEVDNTFILNNKQLHFQYGPLDNKAFQQLQYIIKGYNPNNCSIPMFKFYKQQVNKNNNNIISIYGISDHTIIKQYCQIKSNLDAMVSQHMTLQCQKLDQQPLIDRSTDNINRDAQGILQTNKESKCQQNNKNNIIVTNIKGDIYFNNPEFLNTQRDTINRYYVQQLKAQKLPNTAFKFKQNHVTFWDCLKIKQQKIDNKELKSHSDILMTLQLVNSQQILQNKQQIVFLSFNDKTKRHIIIRYTDIKPIYKHLITIKNNQKLLFQAISKYNLVFTTYLNLKTITATINSLFNESIYAILLDLLAFSLTYIQKNQTRFGTLISNETGNDI